MTCFNNYNDLRSVLVMPIAATAILLTLNACGFSPAAIQSSLKTEDDNALAQGYFVAGGNSVYGADIRAELLSRNIIPSADWPEIDSHQIAIGMGVLSVEASWGQPSDINTTTTTNSQSVQWVYQYCDTCDTSYVYFNNDLVTAIQN